LDGGEKTLGVDGRADRRHLLRCAEIGQEAVISAATGDVQRLAAPRLDLEDKA
jgi:hypothetical protein